MLLVSALLEIMFSWAILCEIYDVINKSITVQLTVHIII